jgi:hypothetical protein
MKMLSAIALAATCLTGTVASPAEERPPFVGGGGAFVCRNWTAIRASAARVLSRAQDVSDEDRTNLIVETKVEDWILGFMSGTEAQSGAATAKESIFCETNDRDIIHRIDLFCKANPESYIVQAALIVSADLMEKKGEAVRRALEYQRGGFVPDVSCWPDEKPD